MAAPATDEAAVDARLQALRQRLGKKQQFEEAVADLAAAVRDHYAGASPALRKSVRHPTRVSRETRWYQGIYYGFYGSPAPSEKV